MACRVPSPRIRNVGLAIEELSGAQPNRASVEGTGNLDLELQVTFPGACRFTPLVACAL